MTDPGVDFSLLSECRLRLVEQGAETLMLDRLGCAHAPTWNVGEKPCGPPSSLIQQIGADGLERSSQRVENDRLPKAECPRTALAQQMGADGLHVLHALEQPDAPVELAEVERVHLLLPDRPHDDDLSGGKATWRAGPHAEEGEGIIRSPSDPEASTGTKRETTWFGDNVHLTETCAVEGPEEAHPMPQLMVQVQTTMATVQDGDMTAALQEDVVQHHLMPEEQIVDTGSVDAEVLVSRQQNHGLTLVGPVLSDNRWQAKAGEGFNGVHVQLDWHAECATCPVRSDGTKSSTTGRVLHVRPHAATSTRHSSVSAGVSGTSRHRGNAFPSGTRHGDTTRAL